MANPSGRGGFKKGQSGDPGGRPRALVSVMEEAHSATLACQLSTLAAAMSDGPILQTTASL
jgi:hypothetical protein